MLASPWAPPLLLQLLPDVADWLNTGKGIPVLKQADWRAVGAAVVSRRQPSSPPLSAPFRPEQHTGHALPVSVPHVTVAAGSLPSSWSVGRASPPCGRCSAWETSVSSAKQLVRLHSAV